MAWTIQYSKLAERQLKNLSPEIAERIRSFMQERVVNWQAPRVLAKKLSGAYEDRIRFRVGDYRVICRIQDQLLQIVVIEVAHRREVYR